VRDTTPMFFVRAQNQIISWNDAVFSVFNRSIEKFDIVLRLLIAYFLQQICDIVPNISGAVCGLRKMQKYINVDMSAPN
jgi:hypothetical protein